MNTLVLAHYYTIPEVQQMADFVGDSLDLSIRAQESNAERIVFAGVKFMAETAKIINPQAEVIIPDITATCSLVEQSNAGHPNLLDTIHNVKAFDSYGRTIVSYINSSFRIKAESDIIVTSANVEKIIDDIIEIEGGSVFFTPDRNMGAYLAHEHPEWGHNFDYYTGAVCEVHDQFKAEEVKAAMAGWYDYGKYLIAHPESPLPVLEQADFVGSTKAMLKWVKNFHGKSIIYVATEEGLLYNMRDARPDLDIRLAPTYSGCQCNACPYMKKNTIEAVTSAIYGDSGFTIDYIREDIRKRAEEPINRMLEWGQK